MQYIKKSKDPERWREGKLASNLRTWRTTWQWVSWIFFLLLLYPEPSNRAACNPETPMSTGKRKNKKTPNKSPIRKPTWKNIFYYHYPTANTMEPIPHPHQWGDQNSTSASNNKGTLLPLSRLSEKAEWLKVLETLLCAKAIKQEK